MHSCSSSHMTSSNGIVQMAYYKRSFRCNVNQPQYELSIYSPENTMYYIIFPCIYIYYVYSLNNYDCWKETTVVAKLRGTIFTFYIYLILYSKNYRFYNFTNH